MLQLTPYTFPLALAAVLSGIAGVMAWLDQRGEDSVLNAGNMYAALMLAITVWSALLLAAMSLTTLPLKLFWFSLFLPWPMYLTIAWFLFAVTYTGRKHWLTRPRLAALLLSPIPYYAVMFTPLRDLALVNPQLTTSGGFVELAYTWGPVVWFYLGVAYAYEAAGTYFLYLKFRRTRNLYQRMAFFIFIAGVTLWIGNIVTFAGLSPFSHIMMVPMVFLLWGVVTIVGLSTLKIYYYYYYHYLPLERLMGLFGSSDVKPLARDFVIQEIESGVIVLDRDDRVVDINRTAKRMMGEGDRVVGRKITDVVDLAHVLGNYEDGDELGEMRDEVWVDTEDDEVCYDVSVSNVYDGEDVVGRVVLIHDITVQKKREERLRDREGELEQQKSELEQQKNKLEHQNERLDRFAGIVSHDLRNPLTVAEGYVEIVEEVVDGEAEDEVERIRKSHSRMEDIIEDALLLARQGKAITETEEVEVAEAVREAWGNVESADAVPEVDVDLVVEGDRRRLLNVFENLFRNALEHGDADTVWVGESGDGFYVEDDGDGIAEDEREQVLDEGYSTSSEGTGLGLSIVQDVVRAHGWMIEVGESESGGARFDVGGVRSVGRAELD